MSLYWLVVKGNLEKKIKSWTKKMKSKRIIVSLRVLKNASFSGN